MVRQTQPKLGGNYTQPHYDPITGRTDFQVFVGWHLYGSYESDAEATLALRQAVCPTFEEVGTFGRTELDTRPVV